MDLQDSRRLVGLDMIKVISCFLVVTLHTCYTKEANISISSILYYSGVIAIPLFFMTNGYLLFGKTEKNKLYTYKKIGRILLLVFILNSIISPLYALFKHQFYNPFSVSILNLFFQKGTLSHFWFFGALIFIYLFFPLLDYLYLHKQNYFFILSVFLVCMQCLVDSLNIFSSVSYQQLFQQHIPQTFRIESHFSYFILGGVVKCLKAHISKYAILKNILLLYIAVIIYQLIMVKNIYPTLHCEYFYNNLLVICLSVMSFSYLSNIQTIKIKREIYAISNLIMVIYIIHPFVIKLYDKLIRINLNVVELIIVYIISALLSWIILKVPYAKIVLKI